MTPQDQARRDQEQLGREGMAALSRGDAAGARALFARLVTGDTSAPAAFAHALACHLDGDPATALAEANRGLLSDPGNLRGLIVKADALVALGEARGAVGVYDQVLALAEAAGARLAPAARPQVEQARQARDRLVASMTGHLMDTLGAAGFREATAPPRFAEALAILTGKAPRQDQKPRAFYYPGLAPIAFHDTGRFDWAAGLTGQTAAIRAEFTALPRDTGLFSPYLEDDPRLPRDPSKRLVANADWNACYLIRDGAPVEAAAAACPRTMAALAPLPLEDVPGRAPFALFSTLAPGAWIEPHTGFLNTRLVCHLPLVVPDGCSFRVGNTTRPWHEGELMVFDDTLEHEARNQGTSDRTVLIFNIWHPDLTEDERHFVRTLLAGIDGFAAG